MFKKSGSQNSAQLEVDEGGSPGIGGELQMSGGASEDEEEREKERQSEEKRKMELVAMAKEFEVKEKDYKNRVSFLKKECLETRTQTRQVKIEI